MATQTIPPQAQALISARTTAQLVADFELTNTKLEATKGTDAYLAVCDARGWVMDALEARNPTAFDKWIDGGEDSPRTYFIG
jgi:hypothetical protein